MSFQVNSNKTMRLESQINKLISYGYTLQGEQKKLKNIHTNQNFCGEGFSLMKYYKTENIYLKDSEKLVEILSKKEEIKRRFNFKNEIYKILIEYIHIVFEEELNLKREQIVMKLNEKEKSFFYFSNFYSIPHSKVFLIIPDLNQPCGIFNESSVFYDGLFFGSFYNYIISANNENYCSVVINPFSKEEVYYEAIEFYLKSVIEKKTELISDLIILCNGFGGSALIKLLSKGLFKSENHKKIIKKIILIDSKHGELYRILEDREFEFWEKKAVNYILSNSPTGTLEANSRDSGE